MSDVLANYRHAHSVVSHTEVNCYATPAKSVVVLFYDNTQKVIGQSIMATMCEISVYGRPLQTENS